MGTETFAASVADRHTGHRLTIGTFAPVFALRFLVSAGFYSIIPYAVFLLPFEESTNALTLAALLIGGRLLAWPIGAWVDQSGAKRPIINIALATTGAFIASWIWTDGWIFLISVIGIAVLNPLTNVALRTLVAHRSAREDHTQVYGWLGSVKTMGIAAGPAMSGVLLLFAPVEYIICLTTALCALSLLTAFGLQDAQPHPIGIEQPDPALSTAGDIRTKTPGISITLWFALIAQWALIWCCLYTLTLSVAPYFDVKFADISPAAVFFVVQSLLSAALLIFAGHGMRNLSQKALGFVFSIGAVLPPVALLLAGIWPTNLPFGNAIWLSLMLAIIISVSEALTVPTVDTIAATQSKKTTGRRFGQLTSAEVLGMALAGAVAWFITRNPTVDAMSSSWVLSGTALLILATVLSFTTIWSMKKAWIKTG
ncbi:MAG: MFS transporter [Pseudomonadota bacterium]